MARSFVTHHMPFISLTLGPQPMIHFLRFSLHPSPLLVTHPSLTLFTRSHPSGALGTRRLGRSFATLTSLSPSEPNLRLPSVAYGVYGEDEK